MNDRLFPRRNRRPSFDLSGDRKPGDRSTREDDRYLFLESIWCARDSLYLSYLGQSIRQAEKILLLLSSMSYWMPLIRLPDFTKTKGDCRMPVISID